MKEVEKDSKIERCILYKMERRGKIPSVKIEPGEGKKVVIKVPYDKELIDKVKTIPGRRWIPEKKYWELPYEEKFDIKASKYFW